MKSIVLILLQSYKKFISPMFPPSCRFYPSCSEYSYESVKKFGIIRGGFYSILRLGKCHPFHPGGYDPVKQRGN